MSYCCDRARSITWGIEGGLPSIPHGVWLNAAPTTSGSSARSSRTCRSKPGDFFTRPSCRRRRLRRSARARPRGGPRGRRRRLRHASSGPPRTTASSFARSTPTSPNTRSTRGRPRRERERIRSHRLEWLDGGRRGRRRALPRRRARRCSTSSAATASSSTGARASCFPRTTEQFRAMLQRRAARHWETVPAGSR